MREESGLHGARELESGRSRRRDDVHQCRRPDRRRAHHRRGRPGELGSGDQGQGVACRRRAREGHLGHAGRRRRARRGAARAGWFGKVVKPDGRGTSNVGIFGGKDGKPAGDATNVVTDYAFIKGEARSPEAAFATKIAKGYKEAFAKAQGEVKDHEGDTAEVTFTPHRRPTRRSSSTRMRRS